MARSTGGIERRKLKRSVARVPASFESGEVRGKGHVKNVSKGGLFLRSDVLPEPGSEIRVLFHTQQGRKVEIEGIVVWSTTGARAAGRPSGLRRTLRRCVGAVSRVLRADPGSSER